MRRWAYYEEASLANAEKGESFECSSQLWATFFLAWPWRRVAHEGWLSVKVCRAGFPSPRLPPAPLGSGHPNPFRKPP